jgi:hypothetical protein
MIGRICATILAAGAALLAPAAAHAQVTETQVKAAFLPRFARYVTWPSAARPVGTQPFVLCVVGSDPFGATLDQAVASQLIDGRRLVVRRLGSAPSANGCHIAFVNGARTRPSGQILAAMAREPILTVTDARHGAQRGIIHFTVVGGRVRFFIDEAQASRHGLAVSSRLLALAVMVKPR